jgi:hypothetical protein
MEMVYVVVRQTITEIERRNIAKYLAVDWGE